MQNNTDQSNVDRTPSGGIHNFEINTQSRDNSLNVGIDVLSDNENNEDSNSQSIDNNSAAITDDLLNMDGRVTRRRVYAENMWAEPLPDLRGQFRNCSLTFYRENPTHTLRLRAFVLREVNVLRTLISLDMTRRPPFASTNDDVFTSFIMRLIVLYDITNTRLTTILTPCVGNFAEHFLHELYNFASSPYRLVDYDLNVRYARGRYFCRYSMPYSEYSESNDEDIVERPISVTSPDHWDEPNVVNTDDEDNENSPFIVISPSHALVPSEVIEINSASGESDVQIIHIDTEPSAETERDQPFRPDRQPNCSSMTRPNESQTNTVENVIKDSSSDDGTIEINTRGTQTTGTKPKVVMNKRKRKIETPKLEKRKKYGVEFRPEVRLGSGTRSSPESSFSDNAGAN
ncbi:Hypothetical protein CINCED_3A021389 [Cinara cedri]|uniref:RING-type E3 ubiquitin transferase n=1 Tax=Cinara cedri TaxID=506608 RepID=A0A5E4MDL3_9HEMI|nr:Hypothetical protein CINCED_3A021389 [Cinara cedri]